MLNGALTQSLTSGGFNSPTKRGRRLVKAMVRRRVLVLPRRFAVRFVHLFAVQTSVRANTLTDLTLVHSIPGPSEIQAPNAPNDQKTHARKS